MLRTIRRNAILGTLLLVLGLSLVANVLLYRKASRPLFEEGDRPLVERTIAEAARSHRIGTHDIRAETFPIVMRLGDRTCVELRRYDRLGHVGACYDRRGRLIEETASVVN